MQMGARFMPDAGLVGGGTGSVNFAQSLKLAQNGLLTNLLTTLTSCSGSSSGATFRDTGTLIDRIYDRTGIRLLRPAGSGALLGSAGSAEPGVLNLLGIVEPAGQRRRQLHRLGQRRRLDRAATTSSGATRLPRPAGQYIVWGNNDRPTANYIVWGNCDAPAATDERPAVTRASIAAVGGAGLLVAVVGLVASRSVLLQHRRARRVRRCPPSGLLFAVLTIASGMLTAQGPVDRQRASRCREAFGFAAVLLFGPRRRGRHARARRAAHLASGGR